MPAKLILLLLVSVAGGAANALAGGGTFMVFPALLFAGVAPVAANATASLILWPGGVASAWVYRADIRQGRSQLFIMSLASAAGAALGSFLLLATSESSFSLLVPWLLLMATAIFTFSGRIRRMASGSHAHWPFSLLVGGQFVIAIYGGYFGAGMGVLMLALYLAAGTLDVHAANGLRTVCGAAINAIAIVIFAVRGALDWKLGIPMLVAGIIGGYFGAILVRRLNPVAARRGIAIYAWVITGWFFFRLIRNAAP